MLKTEDHPVPATMFSLFLRWFSCVLQSHLYSTEDVADNSPHLAHFPGRLLQQPSLSAELPVTLLPKLRDQKRNLMLKLFQQTQLSFQKQQLSDY